MRPFRLSSFAEELLRSCPHTGGGVHHWLFDTARVLHSYCPDKKYMAVLLKAASENCGRIVTTKEIFEAIINSEKYARRLGERALVSPPRAPAWPEYRRDLACQINTEVSSKECLNGCFDRQILYQRSVIPNSETIPPGQILARLHVGQNPLICVGMGNDSARTRLLSDWTTTFCIDEFQFVVPNAMSARTGIAKHGRKSPRCRANAATHRRFIVVEFDQVGDEALQPTLIWHLSTKAPLAMVVHSGGKSLHGWFYVDPVTEEWQRKFFRYAVSLGADPRMWLPEQMARLPNGKRRDQTGTVIAAQPVIYFDPASTEAI